MKPSDSESVKSLDRVTSKTIFSDGEKSFTLDLKDKVLSLSDFIVPDVDTVSSLKLVGGKEYSNSVDKNTNGNPDPGQTLNWFGNGNTTDGFDYGIRGQVDAMANSGDAFFYPVINNQATLVFSTSFDDKIYYETPTGANNIWATANQIDQPGPGIDLGVTDVDALELWGGRDANRFSIYGDPKVAVYNYNSDGTTSALYTQQEIANAIGVDDEFADLVNLDAMMTSGNNWIMFSIDPIEEAGLDGGEIWVWERGSGSADFLKHGGHLWDTDFKVMETFGTASENVNALEAIGSYSGILDAGFEVVPVKSLPLDTVGGNPIPLSI
ncbi:MAG: hypothetical protein F6K53_28385 [Moorea sp. SIO4A1]|nr:hypothetical protein [Moorena sp. SIO4A1]